VLECGVDFPGLGYGPVATSYEYDNDTSNSIQRSLDQLRYHQLLKKNFIPQSYFFIASTKKN
jgi:hypothetical protein